VVRRSALVLLVLSSTLAHAGQNSATLNAGLELLFGGESTSGGLRVHGGFGRSFGDGSIQPTVSLGGTFGYGSLSVDDPMNPESRARATHLQLGPEVTLALRFANGGWVDKRVFVSIAGFFARVDEDSPAGPILDGAPQRGFRIGAGVNWLEALLPGKSEPSWSNNRSQQMTDRLAVILPHQIELVWEDSLGLPRFGVTLAWGL
jgi:hypothetical protein